MESGSYQNSGIRHFHTPKSATDRFFWGTFRFYLLKSHFEPKNLNLNYFGHNPVVCVLLTLFCYIILI
jgi:hypothetical protein